MLNCYLQVRHSRWDQRHSVGHFVVFELAMFVNLSFIFSLGRASGAARGVVVIYWRNKRGADR